MERNYDKVRVICHVCKTEHDNKMYFGQHKKYLDNFSMDCMHCDNWEEGISPPQTFDIINKFER